MPWVLVRILVMCFQGKRSKNHAFVRLRDRRVFFLGTLNVLCDVVIVAFFAVFRLTRSFSVSKHKLEPLAHEFVFLAIVSNYLNYVR